MRSYAASCVIKNDLLISTEHFIESMGYRTVPVEIGSRYTDENWSQKLMTVNEFVERFMGKEVVYSGYTVATMYA